MTKSASKRTPRRNGQRRHYPAQRDHEQALFDLPREKALFKAGYRPEGLPPLQLARSGVGQ